jgi:anti-sigma regulatory factor (Ser/Thr protein kinase)
MTIDVTPPDEEVATVRLAFPPEPRLLGTVRLVVGALARQAGVDSEGVEDLKVAVSETCAVAINETVRAGLRAPIELELIDDRAGGRFGVEVRDRAPEPAGSLALPSDEALELDDRQFGLALAGALVNDLKSEPREGGGHRVAFWRYHDTPDDAAPDGPLGG